MKENGRKRKTRDFCKKVKEITGKLSPRTGTMRSKTGKSLPEDTEVRERWTKYTSAPYKKNPDMQELFIPRKYENEPHIIKSEVRRATHDISNNKSPDLDGIPIELLKATDEDEVYALKCLCNMIWDSGKWPRDWKRSIYIPIPKKGDPRECKNY